MGARVLVFAVVAAAVVLGVAGGAAGSNSTSYNDPAGDSANAPDLTGIAISNDDAGKITFAVSYGNRPGGLNDQDQVQIWIDSDQNGSTGDEAGSDYVVALDKRGPALKHVTPSGLEDTPDSTLSGSADGTTVSIDRSELGNTSKFSFYVLGITRIDNSRDDAPDAQDRVFVYSLTAPRPTQVLVAFNPKAPKAGARFLATVVLVTFDDGSSTIPLSLPVTCRATLNGKPIRARVIPMACVWKLPKSAKGKRFAFTITVTSNGSKGTFGPWRYKVR
jgi:hypothetical protein